MLVEEDTKVLHVIFGWYTLVNNVVAQIEWDFTSRNVLCVYGFCSVKFDAISD